MLPKLTYCARLSDMKYKGIWINGINNMYILDLSK